MSKQAFHVVLTTHNSRTSHRMIDFNVKKGTALELNLEQEITLTQIIGEIVIKNNFKCIAYNICKDHVHLILICTYEKLSNIVKIVKGKSSYLFKRTKGNEWIGRLWSRKFFRADLDVWKLATLSNKTGYIYKDTYLDNAILYVNCNRKKHDLPNSQKLTDEIKSFITSLDEAFNC